MAEELSLVIENPHEGEFLKHIDWNKEEFYGVGGIHNGAV